MRVAKQRGKIAVVDVFTTSPSHSHLHNLMEKLRDDSHVKALSLSQLQAMARGAGLLNLKTEFYRLEIELERQLSASFPKQGDADKIRQLVLNDKEKYRVLPKGQGYLSGLSYSDHRWGKAIY